MGSGRKKECLCTTWGIDGENHEYNGCPLHVDEYKRGRHDAAQMLQEHINRGNGPVTDSMVTAIHGAE